MQNSGNETTSWVAAAVVISVLIFMIRWATPDQPEATAEAPSAAGEIVAEEVPATPASETPAAPSDTASEIAETSPTPAAVEKPVPKPKPETTTAATPPAPAEKPEKMTAEVKAPKPSASPVTAVVSQWAKCWADQDVSCYISSYSTGFEPANGGTWESWKAIRTKKVSAPKSISLTLSPLQLLESTDTQITVQFEQEYRSPNYADKSLKTLVLNKESGGWKIVRETSVDLQ